MALITPTAGCLFLQLRNSKCIAFEKQQVHLLCKCLKPNLKTLWRNAFIFVSRAKDELFGSNAAKNMDVCAILSSLSELRVTTSHLGGSATVVPHLKIQQGLWILGIADFYP